MTLRPAFQDGQLAGSGEGPRHPAVSVVIPTYNRARYLQEALEGLVAGAWSDFEVLVVDQSDDDDTRALVSALDDRFRYVRSERRGACPARNLGAALARADIVAFTDDDCVPQPDWLARIVETFRADPRLEFIFGQLRAPSHDGSGGWFPETIFPDEAQMRRAPWKVVVNGAGANMSCRRDLLLRIGGFDDLLGRHDARVMNADTSMAYKAFRNAHWMASREIEVVHKNGFRRYPELRRLYASYSFELGANFARFLRRGDAYAGTLFVREQVAVVLAACNSVAHRRQPRRLGSLLPYARGFLVGLRVAPSHGYVTGAAMQRLAASLGVDSG
ncbi:MAG TPA: glycosyltransferase [Dehalococcoidia bacterium]